MIDPETGKPKVVARRPGRAAIAAIVGFGERWRPRRKKRWGQEEKRRLRQRWRRGRPRAGNLDYARLRPGGNRPVEISSRFPVKLFCFAM